jgi:hypothetical protein
MRLYKRIQSSFFGLSARRFGIIISDAAMVFQAAWFQPQIARLIRKIATLFNGSSGCRKTHAGRD